jgi:hypothetical protein
MVILTDGIENASRELPIIPSIRTIKALEETENGLSHSWELILTIHTSKMLNIREENVVSFNKIDMVENDE